MLDSSVTGLLTNFAEGLTSGPQQDLLDLIDQDWEAFYREIHGDRLVDGLDSLETADTHHSEAIIWHWEARLALLRGERPPDGYFVYFPTWSRGNMKTSIGRAMLITDALLSYAYGQPGYALIPGGTKAKIKGTAMSVEKMLYTPQVQRYCPALSKVDKNVMGRSRGWTADYISTAARYTFHFIGLDEGVAGANLDNVRPTFIMPDDIDSREDSPVISETRFRIFTTEVLPTRQQNTLVYWAQNLISRFSARYRIEKQHVQVLTNRKPTTPIPAVRGLVTEKRLVDGIVKDIVMAGNPTWRGWSLQRVQDEIDTYGLPAFRAECHPAGTRVRLGVGRNVPIESIRRGDLVLTHSGSLRPVTDLVRRDYSGDLYSIKVAGSTIPVRSTENHPFFVASRPAERWKWHYKPRALNGKDVKRPERLPRSWVRAADLRKGDYLLEPLPPEPERPVDGDVVWQFTPLASGRPASGAHEVRATPELFRLMGYFAAEGDVTGGAVRLTFSEDEREYYEDVRDLFRRVFGRPASISPDNGRSVKVSCSSVIASRFFLDTIGTGSHFKRVPEWALRASESLISEFLAGYIRGDGCKDPSGFTYNSVSGDLAEGVRLMMLRVGVVAALYKLKERTVRLPQGCDYRRSAHWQGDVNAEHAKLLGDLIGIPHEGSGPSHSFIYDGYVYKPVRSITRDRVEDFPVYNFEVEQDESYVAENVASHNCQHEVEQSREGLVLHNWRDEVHVISESEFEAAYGFKPIPKHWPKEWANDWARTKTRYHANVALWKTVSPQSSKLPGMTFIWKPLSFPADSQVEDVAERLLECLTPGPEINKQVVGWRELRRQELLRANALQHTSTSLERIEYERSSLAGVFPRYVPSVLAEYNVRGGCASHERNDIRDIYARVYAMPVTGVNPGKFGGVEALNRAMATDWESPHPFRPEQKGYTRWFLIAPDDLSAPAQVRNGVAVRPPVPFVDNLSPDALHDVDLFRYQMVNWRQRPASLTATGEIVDDIEKANDDYGNALQFGETMGPLKNLPLTKSEEFQALIPDEIRALQNDGPMTKDKYRAIRRAVWDAEEQLEEKYKEHSTEDDPLYEHDSHWYGD